MAHAARAVGILVAVGLLVARRLHDAHARPVGIELVGDDHRQRGARRAVAHLGAGRDDGDDAVRAIDTKMCGLLTTPFGILSAPVGIGHERAAHGRELRGENEAAGAGDALEQAAAADIGDGDILLCVR